jgi:hypothetical protein
MPLDLPDAAASVNDVPDASLAPVVLRSGTWTVYATPTENEGRGRAVSEFVLGDGGAVPLVEDAEGHLHAPFDLDEAYANYLREAWAVTGSTRRLSAHQLALFYRLKRFIPRGAQLQARRALIRWQGQPAFPRWPVDDGVTRLAELYGALLLSRYGLDELGFRWFWPEPYRAALILTHDVEGEDGIRLAVELADLEESLGFRSAFNFGGWYDVDPGVLRELSSRGFEVGMHGIVHDRSLFSSRAEFERQLPLLRELADRLGAVGFRSPATHRVFEWLAELPIEYDGTIPHSDPYEPQPGGCCSLWPFFVGDVVALPYTLPQDHTLLTLLGHRTPDVWLAAADEIERRFGLIHCVSHPDPGYLGDPDKRVVYREFLTAMAERNAVWHELPAEVAGWWRVRSGGREDTRLGQGRVIAVGPSPLDVLLSSPNSGR